MVQPRSTSSTVAPSERKTSSAAFVLAATSLSTLKKPRSIEYAMRQPLIDLYCVGRRSFGRRLAMSVGLGPQITFCSRIASDTVRASGPVWQ
jgi:hypothetical protein